MEQQDQKEGTGLKRQIDRKVYAKYNTKNHGNDEKVYAEIYAAERSARVCLNKIFCKRGFQITEMVSPTHFRNMLKKGICFLGLVMLLAGTLFPRLFFLDCVHAVMPEAAGVESGIADPDQNSPKSGKGIEERTEESAQDQPRELTGEDYERLFDPGRDEYRISFRFLN